MIGPGVQYRPIDLEITKLELIAGDIVKYSHRTDVRVGFFHLVIARTILELELSFNYLHLFITSFFINLYKNIQE